MRRLLVLSALLVALPAHAVVMDWVTVGNPGNAPDTGPLSGTCGPAWDLPCGAVPYTYRIGKYEVTNAQYAEFLNAVAATDTYGLYSPYMSEITRSGSPGSYSYSAVAGRESWPVIQVSFFDALRFANWLHNGQPSGGQDATTTEDGAYTFSDLWTVGTRNPGATVFLPSEDEWYKAAYYDPVSTSYFDYTAGSDISPTCTLPGATANTANCDYSVGALTDVGSYTGSSSPYGTFDQGGNVWEWNEAIVSGVDRGVRGGAFSDTTEWIAVWSRNYLHPAIEDVIGLRVAMIRVCDDGLDNDADGFTDYPSDPGCSDADDLSEKSPLLPCDDGADNDGDGLSDTDDPACSSGNPYVPDPTAAREDAQCQDGFNNDVVQDPYPGLIDFDGGQSIWGKCTGLPGGCPPEVSDPDADGVADPDPQCAGRPWRNNEGQSSGCGLGTELLVLLPPLMWLSPKRRSIALRVAQSAVRTGEVDLSRRRPARRPR